MQIKKIEDLEQEYDLEISKIVSTIKKQKAKKILLQFPDGFKPYATSIAEEIQNRTNSSIFIWFDSCFGACDIPLNKEESQRLGIDLIVQFGHSAWKF